MIRHTWVVRIRKIGVPIDLSGSQQYKFPSREAAEAAINRCVKLEEEFGATVFADGRAFTRSGRNGTVSVYFGLEQHSEVLDTYIDLGLDVILDEPGMIDPDA
jgi:hypothetical protein